MDAYGYIRLSKADRPRKGESPADVEQRQRASLVAQEEAIRAACERNGWRLVRVFEDDGKTGANTRRDGFQSALRAMRRDTVLVVAKQDRLSRDTVDFLTLLLQSDRKGWYIAVLDEKIDTTTASGWLTAAIRAVFAEFERRLIAERTSAALAIIGRTKQLGRPSPIPDDVRTTILSLHAAGLSASAIARHLTDSGVPTSGGKDTWQHSVIARLLSRVEDDATPTRTPYKPRRPTRTRQEA